jgi:hypothetical protein
MHWAAFDRQTAAGGGCERAAGHGGGSLWCRLAVFDDLTCVACRALSVPTQVSLLTRSLSRPLARAL